MRFRIVNEKNNDQKSQRDSSKDPSTRQNSGTKHQKHSFLQMVKNSYDFYMTIGKDQLKDQQIKIAAQKQQKLKKTIKKQLLADQRQAKKLKQHKRLNRINRTSQDASRGQKPSPKVSAQPSRKSERPKNPISYAQPVLPVQDKQIFDVLDIEEPNQEKSEKQVTKLTEQVLLTEKCLKKVQSKSQMILEKIEKVKQELIFQDEGTYEIGPGHQAVLRAQKFIDEHLNFRHEVRQARFVQIASLIKYVKTHGFLTFDQQKFSLLTKVNPYLYSLSESDSRYLITFKLNGLQIQKRLESTKRRMTQVALPQLMT